MTIALHAIVTLQIAGQPAFWRCSLPLVVRLRPRRDCLGLTGIRTASRIAFSFVVQLAFERADARFHPTDLFEQSLIIRLCGK